ncbi:MAG: hypothetical protein JWM53_3102 [bacterium]|nr:hypothetical protein [bacterium]
MRWKILAALGLVVASLLAATVIVACSSSDCKAGQLHLAILLDGTSSLADTITVSSSDPDSTVSQSFPHAPEQYQSSTTTVDVSFPGGYPADKVVHLLVKATAGVTLLGSNAATVHFDPTCTSAHVSIVGVLTPADLSPAPTD